MDWFIEVAPGIGLSKNDNSLIVYRQAEIAATRHGSAATSTGEPVMPARLRDCAIGSARLRDRRV
jgi:hypothetical protein